MQVRTDLQCYVVLSWATPKWLNTFPGWCNFKGSEIEGAN